MASVCEFFGLEPQGEDNPFSSKRLYVRSRLKNKPDGFLIKLATRVHERYHSGKLEAILYDPYTISQLANGKRLARQRMDFLLLFSNHIRVVLEVDGKQHYAEQEQASPQRYAAMVSEDRRLRLVGYEIYRFGGYELQGQAGKQVVVNFFRALFHRHKAEVTSS